MLTLSDVIACAVVPGVTALAVWALVRWLRGSRDADPWPWALGTSTGYVAGEVALRARAVDLSALAAALRELTQPGDAVDWLPGAVAVAAVAGIVLVSQKLGKRRLIGVIAAAALCCALPWRLLEGSRYLPSQELRDAGFAADAWSGTTAVVIIGAAAVVLALAWLSWLLPAADHQPRLRAWLAVATAAGAAALAGLSGSFSYALAIGAVAASLGGCAAAAWFAQPRLDPAGAAGPASVALVGMLICSVAFSETAWWRAVLVAVAWTAAAGWIPGLAKRSPRVAGGLRIAMCIVPLAIAVGTAGFDFAEAIQQQPAEPAESANPYLSL